MADPQIAAETIRPRLAYDVRRWATVFPLGMYAACSFAVGHITGLTATTRFAQVWTWPAVAATLLALAGLLHDLHRKDNAMDTDPRRRTAIEEHWRASNAETSTPSTPSTLTTRSSTTPSPVNDSEAARRSQRNAAATQPTGTSRSAASPAAAISG